MDEQTIEDKKLKKKIWMREYLKKYHQSPKMKEWMRL